MKKKSILNELLFNQISIDFRFKEAYSWPAIAAHAKIVQYDWLRIVNLVLVYSSIFSQVRLADKHGAIGVIVYSDPADSAPGPVTYPRSKYLPCTGVQRGAFAIAHGDPETPGYPSIGRYIKSYSPSYKIWEFFRVSNNTGPIRDNTILPVHQDKIIG